MRIIVDKELLKYQLVTLLGAAIGSGITVLILYMRVLEL